MPGPPTPDRPASGLCRTPAQGSTRGKQSTKVMSLCPRLTCWLPLSSPTGNGGGGSQEMGPDPSDSPGNAMHPSCLLQPLGLL